MGFGNTMYNKKGVIINNEVFSYLGDKKLSYNYHFEIHIIIFYNFSILNNEKDWKI